MSAGRLIMDSRPVVDILLAASAEGSRRTGCEGDGLVAAWSAGLALLLFIAAMARHVGEDMIVCSCNVISDHQIRSAIAKSDQRPRMSLIYGRLGSSVQCGRCAHTIKRIIEQ